MSEQEVLNYNTIAQAIEFIQIHYKSQPHLNDVARHVHLSPHHFHRLFTEWAGTTPKKFLQYLSVEHAKKMLKDQQATLFDTAIETGLSGSGRLHDLFISIEAMTPAEHKNEGRHLTINYSFSATPFGKAMVASTEKGVCHLSFVINEAQSVTALKNEFPKAQLMHTTAAFHEEALQIFHQGNHSLPQVKLHLKGTPFQLKVWQSLLKIPMGELSTYGKMADEVARPKASRAVGTAIGHNPVAFLIPCHRVIQANGSISGYMWGSVRKAAIIGWEAARIHGF